MEVMGNLQVSNPSVINRTFYVNDARYHRFYEVSVIVVLCSTSFFPERKMKVLLN